MIRDYIIEAEKKLKLVYPEDNPSLDELHVAGVTLKGLDECEKVILMLIAALNEMPLPRKLN